MKRSILFVFILGLFLISPFSGAQNKKVIEKIIETGTTDNQVMDHLDILTNRIGGRPIGSDSYEQAEKWAKSKFEEWGMEVEMDEVGEMPIGFNRGPWFGRMLSDDGMILHFATPSYTAGTKGVQRGHVLLEPKTQSEFDRMKGRLNGAWVLITGENDGFPVDISEKADKVRDSIIELNKEIRKKNGEIRRRNRSLKEGEEREEYLEYIDEPALFYRQMREAGILGIIQKSKVPIRAMYDRKNVMDMTWDNLPTCPDIKLDEHQYAIIEQMAKERRYFELEFDIRNHFRMGPIKYHNVIGIIPGTKYPDEYVIMGGHLDAYDVATGGVDDGSGCTPAMEAARLIMEAGGKPKRTILCILWAGEEFGLLGSRHWVEKNKDKLDKISNMFNRDGGPTVPVSLHATDAQKEDLEPIVEVINTINPEFPIELLHRDERDKPTRAWGTDSGPFAVEGVPVMTFGTGDPKGYNFNYREIWHTERDLFNKSIPEYQEQTAVATAIAVLMIANLDHLLSRDGYWREN